MDVPLHCRIRAFGAPARHASTIPAAAAMNYQRRCTTLRSPLLMKRCRRPEHRRGLGRATIAPEALIGCAASVLSVAYRRGDRAQAAQYAQGCWSDLADSLKALYDNRVTLTQKVTLLRHSIGTGVDDGYALLEQVTREAAPEPQYLACKYALTNRQRRAP